MFKFNDRKFWDSSAYSAIQSRNRILREKISALELRIWVIENPKKFKCGDIVIYTPTTNYAPLMTVWGGRNLETIPAEPVKCKIIDSIPTLCGWAHKTIEVGGCTVHEHVYESNLTLVKKKKCKKKK